MKYVDITLGETTYRVEESDATELRRLFSYWVGTTSRFHDRLYTKGIRFVIV